MIIEITILNNETVDADEIIRTVRSSLGNVTYDYEALDVVKSEKEIKMSFDILDRDITVEKIRFEIAVMIDELGLDCSFSVEKEDDEFEDDDIDTSSLLFP